MAMTEVEGSAHVSPDFPVSAATYQRQRCRCDGCRAAAAENMAKIRANKRGRTRLNQLSQTKATAAAARWIRQNDPDLWAQILEDARTQVLSTNPELDVDLRRASA